MHMLHITQVTCDNRADLTITIIVFEAVIIWRAFICHISLRNYSAAVTHCRTLAAHVITNKAVADPGMGGPDGRPSPIDQK